MEQHLVEGADATAKFLVLSDAPSDEQWAERRCQRSQSSNHELMNQINPHTIALLTFNQYSQVPL